MKLDTQSAASGGNFLLENVLPESVATREDVTEDQLMVRDLCENFIAREVEPVYDRLEAGEKNLMPALVKKAGEIGLLSMHVPSAYGGEGLDITTAMLVGEVFGRLPSWSVTMGAHTGIGMQPLIYYGTDAQKQKYLPKLAAGEMIGAYALTEPGSGSDALSAKTKAVLSEDGRHYVLNGTKMWITNAGWADLFTLFAQVDGDKFTAFLVERNFPGVNVGKEEPKLGLHGSSTCQVNLVDVAVPAGNVLGEIGKGHLIAFNILNLGRSSLAGSTTGNAKHMLGHALRYAAERRQFGVPIASFGMIQAKLAEMACRIYAAESMVFRTAGLIDAQKSALDPGTEDGAEAAIAVIEEYCIEASILKIFCTEALDYVVDETLQIFGGYGYSREYPAERAYRDSRINRIFEGTSEINRLFIVMMLLKRAQRKRLDIFGAAQQLVAMLTARSPVEVAGEVTGSGELAEEERLLKTAKQIVVLQLGGFARRYQDTVHERQEAMALLADMVMEIYACDSMLLRTRKVLEAGGGNRTVRIALTRVYIADAIDRFECNARKLVVEICPAEEASGMLKTIHQFFKRKPVNTIPLRRQIAEHLIAQQAWSL